MQAVTDKKAMQIWPDADSSRSPRIQRNPGNQGIQRNREIQETVDHVSFPYRFSNRRTFSIRRLVARARITKSFACYCYVFLFLFRHIHTWPIVQPEAGQNAQLQNVIIRPGENPSAIPPCHSAKRPRPKGGTERNQHITRPTMERTKIPNMPRTASAEMIAAG